MLEIYRVKVRFQKVNCLWKWKFWGNLYLPTLLFPNYSTLQTECWKDVNGLPIANPLWGSRVLLIPAPDCTFSLCFGIISGEFSQVMAHILVRSSQAKIPMANQMSLIFMPLKCTTKGVIGIYRIQIQPSDQDFVALSSQWLDRLDIEAYQESRHGFLLATCNCDLCMVKAMNVHFRFEFLFSCCYRWSWC